MKQEPTKEQIAEYLISNTIDHLVAFLIEDQKLSLEDALDKVYNSEVIKMLQDKEAELYVQSPAYVYEMLNANYKQN